MEKWNKLCRALSEEISNDLAEAPFEREVIYALDSILGWDRFFNVKSQVPVKMGVSTKFIDIIVHNEDGIDLFVIEVKKPNISLLGHEEQLYSYMIQKRLNLGVLIGEKIQIHYDNGNKTVLIEEIEFKRDSQKGLSFTNNFHKGNYSEENIQKYIGEKLKEKEELRHEKLRKEKELKNIKKLKSELVSQNYNDKIRLFLKDEFQNEYSENVVDKVFENLKINFEHISQKVDQVYFRKTINSTKRKNNTGGTGVNTYVIDSFKNLDKNLIDYNELVKLLDLEYSRHTFKIGFPFLIKEKDLSAENKERYWNERFNINNEIYFACSQWSSSYYIKKEDKTNGEIRKERFDYWLKKIKKEL